jgi:hypothetical protein
MCSHARCARCGKSTGMGCGMHVNAVFANLQPAQRCGCADQRTGGAAGPDPRRGW